MQYKKKWFYFLMGALLLGACGGGDSDDNSTPAPPQTTYSLSGLIYATNNTATDSDVNDPAAPYQFNDSPAYAQAIPNPVLLGGYINMPGEGAQGRSYTNGDMDDFFHADLKAGQVIQLFIASNNLLWDDLDLELWDIQQNLVSASLNRGNTEAITVPRSGRYYIRVYAYSGASNYTLSIGQNTATFEVNALNLDHDFALGQVAVTFASATGFTSQAAAEAAFAPLGLRAKAGEPSQRMLFELPPQNSHFKSLSTSEVRFSTEETQRKYETLLAVKAAQRQAGVIEASPNYRYTTQNTPNDTLYQYQWHYSMINLSQAWTLTRGSADVVVAVIDTGVLVNHPDLQGKLVDGYDFISDPSISLDGDGIDSNPNDPGDNAGSSSRTSGSSFHGTHVAGTIGALTNNSRGVAGVGWNTRIMPLRVLGKGGAGYDYDIEQAIRYAMGMSNDARRTPSRPADIINLSLGGPTISNSFRQLMQEAYQRNIFVVSAAGNEGSSAPSYPAALDTVISVAAVDINRQRAAYSNYGATITLSAPGGADTPDINGDGQPDKIFSTVGDDSLGNVVYLYADMMGTSMAAPHVAGVIALMKAVHPRFTPAQFTTLLHSGRITSDLGRSGYDDHFGYGLIDAYRAVLAATELTGGSVAPATPPQLSISPASLNFGLNSNTLTLSLNNAGGSPLSISNISENSGGYLDMIAQNIDNNGTGTYSALLKRDTLSPGTYNASFRVVSNGGTVDIPVIWQVAASGSSDNIGDAGYQYVLLVDANTEDTVQEYKASNRYGFYSYQFTNILPGQYKIVSGSDNNNDFTICDPGEACGAYTTLTRPITINADRTLNGLDFTVSLSGNFMGSLSVVQNAETAQKTLSRQRTRIIGAN
jgi:serine protease